MLLEVRVGQRVEDGLMLDIKAKSDACLRRVVDLLPQLGNVFARAL